MNQDPAVRSLTRSIQVRGVRQNNLRGIDLDIPHGQWLAVCGRSGSGKSSLAVRTLYAEGQRRYVESFSPYTRQFLEQAEKPAADSISGVPPAVLIATGQRRFAPASTIGSVSGIADYLRLLFARVGLVHCPDCGIEARRDQPQSVAEAIAVLPEGTRLMIGFRISDCAMLNETEDEGEMFRKAGDLGFARAVVGGKTVELAGDRESASGGECGRTDKAGALSPRWGAVVVDRLVAGKSTPGRTRESAEAAFQMGGGRCVTWWQVSDRTGLQAKDHAGPAAARLVEVDGQPWAMQRWSRGLECPQCERQLPDPEPALLNPGSPLGACPACQGCGGSCKVCDGQRLNPVARSIQLDDKNLPAMESLPVGQLVESLERLAGTETGRPVARALIEPALAGLRTLASVGLAGLPLSRGLNAMSDGQARRVLLASGLGTALVNMLYVLDEPTAGLHPADAEVVLESVRQLHARPNTVVVVDHQPAWIFAAERVIELGPGSGAQGGTLVHEGSPASLLESSASTTGQHLAGRRGQSWSAGRRRKARGWLELAGASGRNLKSLDVRFPLGCLCVVSGVSGAGKSTLVRDTLLPLLAKRLGQSGAEPLPATALSGERGIEDVVWIDAVPLPRTARSVPATVIGAFDEIRRLMASTAEAKAAGLKPGSFSFNVAGGRCPKCAGIGKLTVDMQFLADVTIRCDECQGQRFQPPVLAARYRGLNIASVLDLTADEGFTFFRGQPKIQAALRSLKEAGLEYLRLGQPLDTLSHGETQRLRLALRLASPGRKRTLYLLDQPTAGLHMDDVTRLVDSLNALLDVGHSLVMIDHDLQLLAHADWIIDLGPGADEAGGEVVVAGPPEDLIAATRSLTGRFLRAYLQRGQPSSQTPTRTRTQ